MKSPPDPRSTRPAPSQAGLAVRQLVMETMNIERRLVEEGHPSGVELWHALQRFATCVDSDKSLI